MIHFFDFSEDQMAYQRSEKMEQRLAENRKRILEAARKLVAKGGLREARMGSVATEAGLSTGALYRYFPSKADLFVDVLNAAVDREIVILDQIAEGPGPARERLADAVALFVRRALRGPNLAYAFIAEPTEADVDAARILCRMRFGEVFKRIIRAGIEARQFPRQDVDASAACIVGAFTEALVGPIAPSTRGVKDEERLVNAVSNFCVAAVVGV
ncbi:MAG: AcrR family transcriptional regulator [Myxococcota bacterium]|jgi:AcrR family transcriptional regulator